MGVDVVMYVKPDRPISDKQLKRLSYEFAASFPAVAWQRGPSEHGSGWYALSRETSEGDINVSSGARYYGPDYERGPCVEILAAAQWLEEKIGAVYYGGDDCDPPELFDAAARKALWAHFLKHGGRPYREAFGSGDWCGYCDGPMNDYSWKGDETTAKCPACGATKTRIGRRAL